MTSVRSKSSTSSCWRCFFTRILVLFEFSGSTPRFGSRIIIAIQISAQADRPIRRSVCAAQVLKHWGALCFCADTLALSHILVHDHPGLHSDGVARRDGSLRAAEGGTPATGSRIRHFIFGNCGTERSANRVGRSAPSSSPWRSHPLRIGSCSTP